MGILLWVLVALIGAALGKLLFLGEPRRETFFTVLVGTAGAMVCGAIALAFGIGSDPYDPVWLVTAVAGCVGMLLAYRAFLRLAIP